MSTLLDISSEWLNVSFASGGVLHVQLNRPPVNAFSEKFWRAYGETFDAVTAGKAGDVRVIVLSSAIEKHFTAGLDIVEAASFLTPPSELDIARRSIHLRQHILDFQHAISAPERCAVPVIAALHGTNIGLAVDMMLACDIRYAASDAKFSIKEVDIGLASDIGTLSRLRHAVGSSSAFHELAYTARFFPATEAHHLGLVSKVVEGGRDAVLKEALALGKVIAAKSPVAVATSKTFLLNARDNTVADSLNFISVWNAAMVQSNDTQNAIAASRKKTQPVFDPIREKVKAKL